MNGKRRKKEEGGETEQEDVEMHNDRTGYCAVQHDNQMGKGVCSTKARAYSCLFREWTID
jgi:hypothetical protein